MLFLKTIVLPDGIESIGEFAFRECYNLKEIFIPNSVKSIGRFAFDMCIWLENIILPDSLEEIGDGAFDSTGLTSVTIPKNVKYIGLNPFCYTTSLKEIIVSEENERYYSENGVLFDEELKKLCSYPTGRVETDYSIPSNIETIGSKAFQYANFSSINIPDSVIRISVNAFWYSNLQKIFIPKDVSTMTGDFNSNPFYGCTNLVEITVDKENSKYFSSDGILFENEGVLICYPAGKKDTEYRFHNDVRVVKKDAFYNVKNLKKVVFVNGLQRLIYPFYFCRNLESVVIPKSVYEIQGLFDMCDKLPHITCIKNSYAEFHATYNNIDIEYAKIISVSISKLPNKLCYGLNEDLILDGLELDVTYEEETSCIITDGYNVSNYDFSTIGKKNYNKLC